MTTDINTSKFVYELSQFNHFKSKNSVASHPIDVKGNAIKRMPLFDSDVHSGKRPKILIPDSPKFVPNNKHSLHSKNGSLSNQLNNLNGCKANYLKESSQKHADYDNCLEVNTKSNHVISIHETYQLGYLTPSDENNQKSALYIFDFVDGLEVSYPVSITSPDALPLDLPPLFIEPNYTDQLTALAADALSQLTKRIESWFLSCTEAENQEFIWRHMNAHKLSTELRYHTIRFLEALDPSLNLLKLDPQSPTVDGLFSNILNEIGDKKDKTVKHSDSSHSIYPVVSLCLDPDHCLDVLRIQIITLLKRLLPRLVLPKDFDSKRDLIPLLDMVCASNSYIT